MTLAEYTNGNVSVSIDQDGTKIRKWFGKANPIHPESMDVKITNYCDMNCAWCHEKSSMLGKHADLDRLLKTMEDLPAGVEIAIGGGNPLTHPDLTSFLNELGDRGLIANMTVNSRHIQSDYRFIKRLLQDDLIKGLGISYTSQSHLPHISNLARISNNIVFHLVMGVNQPAQIDRLIRFSEDVGRTCKVLILGYKQFGRGLDYYDQDIADNKYQWYIRIAKFFKREGLVLSFDNLALDQLHLWRYFKDEAWDKFYMGKDGEHTMYVDAVQQEYAKSSTSEDRVPFDKASLLTFFKNMRLE